MDIQAMIDELEALRVTLGRHMMALDAMPPMQQTSTLLCDAERTRRVVQRALAQLEK